jgi:hypothetical protein
MFPDSLMATEKSPIHTSTESNEIPPEIREMIDRLNEIKNMDKSSLARLEKKELRKEVRAIKKSVRASGNGIYISSGAIIVILLLIIIF